MKKPEGSFVRCRADGVGDHGEWRLASLYLRFVGRLLIDLSFHNSQGLPIPKGECHNLFVV